MNYSKYNHRKSYEILDDRQYFSAMEGFSSGKIFTVWVECSLMVMPFK